MLDVGRSRRLLALLERVGSCELHSLEQDARLQPSGLRIRTLGSIFGSLNRTNNEGSRAPSSVPQEAYSVDLFDFAVP